MNQDNKPRALTGLRVIEVAHRLGYAGKLYRDLGAEVILIESPGGHPTRQNPALFAYLNAGKRSHVLDLDTKAGLADFAVLCRASDVILDDRAMSWWSRRGLSYEALAENAPDLVWASATPFGQTGPYAGCTGDDAIALATGGMAWLTGYEETGPLAASGHIATYAVSKYAAVMSLLAVLGRENVGGGQYIDISMQEVMALGTETAPQFQALKGVTRRRLGEGEKQAGLGVYPCRDGYILIYASEQGLGTGWTRLVEWLIESGVDGAESLQEEAWLKNSHKGTPEAIAAFRTILTRFTLQRDKQALFEEGQRRRIAIAPVNTAADVLADPQLLHEDWFEKLEIGGRILDVPGKPYRLSETPFVAGTAVPALGEHSIATADAKGDGNRTPPRKSETIRLPLEGVRVVDFTWVGAGPFTTKILADFGAEVIKIESFDRPDQLRRAEPLVGGRGLDESGYFANRNTHKKSVALDMKLAESRETAMELCRTADIVANSFTHGVMERFGLGYDEVRAINPGIIYLSMPLSSPQGPYRSYLGYGMSIAALVGMLHETGVPGRAPVGTGTNYPDHLPNPLHAAFALLASLYFKRRGGGGQSIMMSQIESTLASFPEAVLRYGASGEITQPGEPSEGFAPYGVFACLGNDRWCAITVRNDKEFAAFAAVIDRPDLATDPAFSTAASRISNSQALAEIVTAWTTRRLAEDVVTLLQVAGVPAGIPFNPKELLNDPQLLARGFWQTLNHKVMGDVLYHGIAAQFSSTSTRYRRGAPLLGEHTDELPALTGSADKTARSSR